MTTHFALSLKGRIRNFNLPVSRALVPIYEAIINSIHAIEEAHRSNGKIVIEIVRSGSQQIIEEDGKQITKQPITGFKIFDNGIGFNKVNFDSFCTSDSTHKEGLGGRGIGRLSWLKAFRNVNVESVYVGEDGRTKRRVFKFSVDGVTKDSESELSANVPSETTITLSDIEKSYLPSIPKKVSTLGAKILDHCLLAINANLMTSVTVKDGEEEFDISGEVSRMFKKSESEVVKIGNFSYKMTHLKISSSDDKHRILYLANQREVQTDFFVSDSPIMKHRFQENGVPFWWLSLVESKVLDEHVNSERDGFNIPQVADPMFPDQPSLEKIKQQTKFRALKKMHPFLAPVKERAKERVNGLVERIAPEYRYVVAKKGEEIFGQIDPDFGDDRIEVELHRVKHQMEMEQRIKAKQIMNSKNVVEEKMYDEFISDANELGKANLAKYIVHRRTILDLFKKRLTIGKSNQYEFEAAVHKLIFPLQKTSDDVPYEQQNLWMIDERLAYHYFLASDLRFQKVTPIKSNDAQRPDIIIFIDSFALADHQTPYNSIVIIEFKRPGRDDYKDDENPISQVYEYARTIRSGHAKDRHGRPLNISAGVPFYCYIVCDITPKLKNMAENFGLTETPDVRGYFGFNKNISLYVEIISFEKLVDDAEKRNRVLFEKLNLPKDYLAD